MWLLDIFPWDKHGGQVVMRKRRASVLDIGGEWRVDLDRVAVARRPVLVRSIRLSFLAHSGYSASWLQRLTSTDARRSGFDTGTSRPQRRRGEGRSADAPSPSALSAPTRMQRTFLLMRVVQTFYTVVFRSTCAERRARPVAVTPKERKPPASPVLGF